MKISFIASYPPRTCGIATFTQNLFNSVVKNGHNIKAGVIAMTDCPDGYSYPPEVEISLNTHCQKSYLRAANYLNESSDLVLLQHEYGIFGGQDGAYILSLLEALEIPVIVTFHTILKTPSSSQKYVLQKIGKIAKSIVVMSRLAKHFLEDIYQLPAEKVVIIEHGVPDLPMGDVPSLRSKLGFADRKVLFTFGLLGRGKGIETAINALPAIVEKHPETLYVVLGKTHPAIVRESGEEYRESLLALAKEKGVAENIRFEDSFASEENLWEYLQACDVYVVPYLQEAQITSGTLAYSVGAGAAVVSTPFWHAKELLEEGRGRLFDFQDSNQLANIVNELLSDTQQLKDLRSKAFSYGKQLKWGIIGRQYLGLFRQILTARPVAKKMMNNTIPEFPPLRFNHLNILTDDTGIIQHATFAIPNRFEGYCLDDNARALIAALMASKRSSDKWFPKVATTYLSYIYHCQNEDGSFRNFMSYSRQFLEEKGSEDSCGRAIWALGHAVANAPSNGFYNLARTMFHRALPHAEKLEPLRSISYTIMGIYYYLKKHPGDEHLLNLMHQLRNRLCKQYDEVQDKEWPWFEPYLTYCNAIIPLALFQSLELMPDERIEKIAVESTVFLEKMTLIDGMCQPIGCEKFYYKGKERSFFDQQPVDAMTKTLLFIQAYNVTREKQHFKNAMLCLNWFHGKNALHLPLYEPETGGCHDGLTAEGVNLNQGAESTLSYLIARMAMDEAIKKQLPPQNKRWNHNIISKNEHQHDALELV